MDKAPQPDIAIDTLSPEGKTNACASLRERTGLTFTPAASKPGGVQDILVSAEAVPVGSMTYQALAKMNEAGLLRARHKGLDPATQKWAGGEDDFRIVVDRLTRTTAGLPPAPAPRPAPRMKM